MTCLLYADKVISMIHSAALLDGFPKLTLLWLIVEQVKEGVDDRPILQYVHDLYHELGIQDLTVQIDYT